MDSLGNPAILKFGTRGFATLGSPSFAPAS
jgi:hypothetical protein